MELWDVPERGQSEGDAAAHRDGDAGGHIEGSPAEDRVAAVGPGERNAATLIKLLHSSADFLRPLSRSFT